MTQPAKRNQKQQVYTTQKRQIWALLAIVAVAFLYELMTGFTGVVIKSVLAGAALNFIAQSAFTYVAYRVSGAQARTQIMPNMYLGQMLKWLITLVGFALIFMCIKPIMAALVIISYVAMQLCHTLSMLKLR